MYNYHMNFDKKDKTNLSMIKNKKKEHQPCVSLSQYHHLTWIPYPLFISTTPAPRDGETQVPSAYTSHPRSHIII